MGKITIPQSTLQVKGPNTQFVDRRLPMSLALQTGSAFESIGKVVSDIAKEQKAIDEEIELNDLKRKTIKNMGSVSSQVSRNDSLDFALTQFDKLTPISLYDKDLEGKSKRIQNKFKLWYSKNKDSYYTSITKKVTGNHLAKVKDDHSKSLTSFALNKASTDREIANKAIADEAAWFQNEKNRNLYTDSEWTNLKDKQKLDTTKTQLYFGVKNHPTFILKNYEDVKRQIGEKEAKKLQKKALEKIASDNNFKLRMFQKKEKASRDET